MLTVIRSVFRRAHHAPWVCAAIILVAGLANWAWFSPKQAPPPEPEREAVIMGGFLDAPQPSPSSTPSSWTDEPFSLDPSQPTTPAFPFDEKSGSQNEGR